MSNREKKNREKETKGGKNQDPAGECEASTGRDVSSSPLLSPLSSPLSSPAGWGAARRVLVVRGTKIGLSVHLDALAPPSFSLSLFLSPLLRSVPPPSLSLPLSHHWWAEGVCRATLPARLSVCLSVCLSVWIQINLLAEVFQGRTPWRTKPAAVKSAGDFLWGLISTLCIQTNYTTLLRVVFVLLCYLCLHTGKSGGDGGKTNLRAADGLILTEEMVGQRYQRGRPSRAQSLAEQRQSR